MLAMVASTPKAAAGLAILRERSDMPRRYPDAIVLIFFFESSSSLGSP
jgi:hypothetical protein